MKNNTQVTFNEFTKNLFNKGMRIVDLKIKQIKEKSQLFLSVSKSKTPIIFNWNEQDKRWILAQDN